MPFAAPRMTALGHHLSGGRDGTAHVPQSCWNRCGAEVFRQEATNALQQDVSTGGGSYDHFIGAGTEGGWNRDT
jgi:hypothetical protein